ncbi:GNAT family N-acetyltransferase [Winslowiella iniecta]|uniref:Acetyltransferase n=1 Tax=Winslowiella iniecta TaxID=1560201 RepID=A0A0L7TAH1_9GAMM|nr:GNAT family N-acetyltransferase [Winslowiella iniecta]KOC92369.1 acetyltransferase [Winslowiella iniecta]KOC92443.1 acetyltransferase [Winslowiella iniecta]
MSFVLLTQNDNPMVNWQELAELIEKAGLGARDITSLKRAYQHSQFSWFGFNEGKLMATAHAISDLTWSSYLSDVVIDPAFQGKGYGRQLMQSILDTLSPFGKVIIYAMLDKTEFYQHLNFHPLNTAMVYAPDNTIIRLRAGGFIN